MVRILSVPEGRRLRRIAVLARIVAGLAVGALMVAGFALPAAAHPREDGASRIAVVSAFPPEMSILKADLQDRAVHSMNGVEFLTGRLEGRDVVLFLSGISVVNAAMTVQLALDRFHVQSIVFSGIAGGVDPGLRIGDVVIADRWGQYLEMLFARKAGDGWEKPPFFEYPFANFGMMFPRSVTVSRASSAGPETRFWFPVDETLLAQARQAATTITLDRCTAENRACGMPPGSRSAALAYRAGPSSTMRRSAATPSRPSARGCSIWKAPPWRMSLSQTAFRSSRSGAYRTSPEEAGRPTSSKSSSAWRRATRPEWSRP